MGQNLVCEMEEKVVVIRNHLKAAQDRQKSYVNLKREEISFEVGDNIFLKVSHWKRIICFSQKGKVSPKFIGPYEILNKVCLVEYKLELPPELSKIYNVFHISMLHRYRSNLEHVVQIEEFEVQPNVSYEEKPLHILALKNPLGKRRA
ncbi:Chromo domain-containing protein [Gossypium australe]|uniref:Chromo domain-containing protein n=1 Tax=Gossypium australe TaxID=47621 RepID=A0A5B6WT14_9ROSI|nr:Chromo domain-containing protein [Gossypium australe]